MRLGFKIGSKVLRKFECARSPTLTHVCVSISICLYPDLAYLGCSLVGNVPLRIWPEVWEICRIQPSRGLTRSTQEAERRGARAEKTQHRQDRSLCPQPGVRGAAGLRGRGPSAAVGNTGPGAKQGVCIRFWTSRRATHQTELDSYTIENRGEKRKRKLAASIVSVVV